MYYCDRNFKTKKLLKEAVASGREVTVFSPEPHERQVENGKVCCGGPHYPAAHTWYATVTLKNGVVVGVK